MSVKPISISTQFPQKPWESKPQKVIDFMDHMFTDYKVSEKVLESALLARNLTASRDWNVELNVAQMRAIKERCLGSSPSSPSPRSDSSPKSPSPLSSRSPSPQSPVSASELRRPKGVVAGPQDGVVAAISAKNGAKKTEVVQTVKQDLSDKDKSKVDPSRQKSVLYTEHVSVEGKASIPVVGKEEVIPLVSRAKVYQRKVHTIATSTTTMKDSTKVDQGALIKARGQKN